MADELGALGCGFIDLELGGMAKVFIDLAVPLGSHSDQHADAFRIGQLRQLLLLGVLGGDSSLALLLNGFLIRLARLGVIHHFHRVNLLGGELGAAVFAQQAHRIGAALAAVAHHVHLALAGILQRLEFLRRGPALAIQAKHRAMLGRGNQRHDVVQESAA